MSRCTGHEGTTLGTRRALQADHQGSIIGVASSSGTSFAINAYDPCGIPNATNQGRFQYTGQAWLPELGMSHYKARIYTPTPMVAKPCRLIERATRLRQAIAQFRENDSI